MDIETVGLMLEEKGLTHSEIDAWFEHHGVKGQQWGVRHKRNRELNKASRQKDRAEIRTERAKAAATQARQVDRARGQVASGKVKRDFQQAKADFKVNKREIGSREARKILNEHRAKKMEIIAKAQEARDGKEEVQARLIKVGAELISIFIPK